MKRNRIRKIVTTGLLIAVAYVSLYFIRIPIIPSASFLRFDIKDVFIAIMGLLFGPLYALIGAIGVSLLQMLSVSEYGLIGFVMNVVSVSSFTVTLSYFYKKSKTNTGLIIGLLLGCVFMTVSMLLWNYLISPLYMGVTREVVKGMLLPVFLPFNLIKGVINAAVTYILFVSVKKINIVKNLCE